MKTGGRRGRLLNECIYAYTISTVALVCVCVCWGVGCTRKLQAVCAKVKAHPACPGPCSWWVPCRITKEQWGWLAVSCHHSATGTLRPDTCAGKGQRRVVYQSTGRLSRLSRGTCADQPLEGTSAIDIGRGGGEAKSEAGNCAQGGLQRFFGPLGPQECLRPEVRISNSCQRVQMGRRGRACS